MKKTSSRRIKDVGSKMMIVSILIDILMLVIVSWTNIIVDPILSGTNNIMFFIGLVVYFVPLLIWYDKKVDKWKF